MEAIIVFSGLLIVKEGDVVETSVTLDVKLRNGLLVDEDGAMAKKGLGSDVAVVDDVGGGVSLRTVGKESSSPVSLSSPSAVEEEVVWTLVVGMVW